MDETYLPVRASVTRRPADGYATPVIVVVTANKMIITKQSARALTVSSERVVANGASVPQVVRSFPSGAEMCIKGMWVFKGGIAW